MKRRSKKIPSTGRSPKAESSARWPKKISKEKIWQWVKDNRAILIVFTIYLVITFIAILFHENWKDEAQAWLLARDCSPIELIDRMKYEGHFLPWYLILMPFAKLGFPYITTNIISWLITASAAWLMLKHLPCRFYKRVIFVFMLPMIYLYPVISRCYCLLPLGTILAIMFYKDRFKKPLRYLFSILIIANVHVYTFGFALIMGMEFLVDWLKKKKDFDQKQNKSILGSIIIVAIIAVLTYLPLFGSLGEEGASGLGLKTHANNIKQLFVYAPIKFFEYIFSGPLQSLAYFLTGFLIVWEFFTRKAEFFKIFFAIFWQCIIYCFIFSEAQPQRATTIIFIVLFFIACRAFRERKISPAISTWSIVTILADLLFVFVAAWIEIDTGNISLASLAFFSMIFILISLYTKKKAADSKVKCYKIGYLVAKSSLIILAILQVWAGIVAIQDEVENSFSDASATAEFINTEIADDSIFLTSQGTNLHFVSIIPYLKNQKNRFYNVGQQIFYTFATQLVATEETYVDPINIKWKDYCLFSKDIYYINLGRQFYEDGFNPDGNFAPISNLEKEGVLELVFDIFSEKIISAEHYTIYKVNPSVCSDY